MCLQEGHRDFWCQQRGMSPRPAFAESDSLAAKFARQVVYDNMYQQAGKVVNTIKKKARRKKETYFKMDYKYSKDLIILHLFEAYFSKYVNDIASMIVSAPLGPTLFFTNEVREFEKIGHTVPWIGMYTHNAKLSYSSHAHFCSHWCLCLYRCKDDTGSEVIVASTEASPPCGVVRCDSPPETSPHVLMQRDPPSPVAPLDNPKAKKRRPVSYVPPAQKARLDASHLLKDATSFHARLKRVEEDTRLLKDLEIAVKARDKGDVDIQMLEERLEAVEKIADDQLEMKSELQYLRQTISTLYETFKTIMEP